MKHVILICLIPFLIGNLTMTQGNAMGPAVLSRTDPKYSEEARKAGVETMVLATLVVREDGTPTKIRIARGAGFGLDEKAVEAIEAWHFKPSMRGNLPVPMFATVEVNFRLLNADHKNQIARLNFTLPPGASRPELTSGEIPANPSTPGDQFLRIRLQVSADGTPANFAVLESSDGNWEKAVLHKLQSWRFRPSMLGGTAVEAEGVFELTRGRERPLVRKQE
jgi:TonB family protein